METEHDVQAGVKTQTHEQSHDVTPSAPATADIEQYPDENVTLGSVPEEEVGVINSARNGVSVI